MSHRFQTEESLPETLKVERCRARSPAWRHETGARGGLVPVAPR